MNQKAILMKTEIRKVTSYHSLIICKKVTTLGLACSAYYVGYRGYFLSPLYILLLLNILPPIISFYIKENYLSNNKIQSIFKDTPFLLSQLKTKYQYTKIKYISNTVSYLFTLFLLILWQYNYITLDRTPALLIHLPYSIFLGSVLTRFTLLILYRIKIPYDILHNNL